MKLTTEDIKLAEEMKEYVITHLAKEFEVFQIIDDYIICFVDKVDKANALMFNASNNKMLVLNISGKNPEKVFKDKLEEIMK